MDLHTRLREFGGPIEAVPAETIDEDLVRGQRAVRRRRVAQTAGGSAFAVAAVVAAVVFGGATGAGPGGPGHQPATSAGALQLVRYGGPQPKNFTIEKVPEGFFVQKDHWGGLTIAPIAARRTGPSVDPSTDPLRDPDDFTGKIAVYLEQKAYREGVAGEPVTVGDHQGILVSIGPTRQLLIEVSPKVYATVQVDVPLSRDQILELGAGLRVSPDAVDRMAAGTGK